MRKNERDPMATAERRILFIVFATLEIRFRPQSFCCRDFSDLSTRATLLASGSRVDQSTRPHVFLLGITAVGTFVSPTSMRTVAIAAGVAAGLNERKGSNCSKAKHYFLHSKDYSIRAKTVKAFHWPSFQDSGRSLFVAFRIPRIRPRSPGSK